MINFIIKFIILIIILWYDCKLLLKIFISCIVDNIVGFSGITRKQGIRDLRGANQQTYSQ